MAPAGQSQMFQEQFPLSAPFHVAKVDPSGLRLSPQSLATPRQVAAQSWVAVTWAVAGDHTCSPGQNLGDVTSGLSSASQSLGGSGQASPTLWASVSPVVFQIPSDSGC